jgi:hypothetical protein
MPRRVSQWFLTYPKCDAPKDALKTHLETVDTIVNFVIATEKHKDETNHLHAYIKYTDGIFVKDALANFDFTHDEFFYHGNYQPCRSLKGVIGYCTKEDDYISNINISAYKKKKNATVTAELIKSKTARDALNDGDITYHSVKQYIFARSVLLEPYTPRS